MEVTYLRQHCRASALAGLCNSLESLATSTDHGDLNVMAKSLFELTSELLQEYQKDRTRSNLGLRNASEYIKRDDGVFGQKILLKDIANSASLAQRLKSAKGNVEQTIDLNTCRRWTKLIHQGQEYHSYEEATEGCFAIVNLGGDDGPRAVRICHIVEVNQPVAPSLSGEASSIVLICEVFCHIPDSSDDPFVALDLGFLAQQEVEPDYFCLKVGSLRYAALIAPVDDTHYVILPHSKVRSSRSALEPLFADIRAISSCHRSST